LTKSVNLWAGSAEGTPLVHPAAVVGERCRISPFAIVEQGAVLGPDCVLEPFSRICSDARLGHRVRLGQGAIVGGAPQHSAWVDGACPVLVGDDVRIGEYATVNGGMMGRTEIGDGAMLMAYCHVGHDCVIGKQAVVANAVQLAGHVQVGNGANLGGGTLVHQKVRIGQYAFVAGGIRLERDLVPWSRAMGSPARWAGVNRIALERAGWNVEKILSAEGALRMLLRKGHILDVAMENLLAMGSEESMYLARFCKEGGRGFLRPAR